MKIKSVLLASLLSVVGVTAFAQTDAVNQIRKDNALIRQDNREIRSENRDIHRDNVGINKDKRDIARDQAAIRSERRDAQHDQRREDADITKGDLKGAQKLEKARQHENNEIKAAQRNIHRDKVDIAHDRKDRSHDAAARKDERAERAAEVAKRNHDAGAIH